MDELYHHGIKGQKWGVRRYQEPSGTWTEEGLRRRRKYEMTPAKKKMLDEDYIANKQTIHYDWDVSKKAKKGIIEKGTPIYRTTTRQETLDSKRKYVSITRAGADNYVYDVGGDAMPFDPTYDGQKYTYRFEASKDLKVAKVKDLADYTESLYGAKFVNRYGAAKEAMWREERMLVGYDGEYINSKETNKFINHFKELGYDAIPDMVDLGNYENMSGAMIFLNPYESLKVTDVYENLNKGLRYERDIENARSSGKLDKYKIK